MIGVRQVLIGFDAMEWSLVRHWAAEGKLPAIKSLMERGLHAQLATTADCLPDTTWPALCCGVNPGKLGKYFYLQYEASSGRLRYTSDSEVRATPFWEHLARSGVRVGLADVPHMPFKPFPGGFRLSNWGSHDNVMSPVCQPDSLLDEVHKNIGPHPVGDCEKFNHGPASQERLRRAIIDGIRTHGRLFRWLMRERAWDVFFGVFAAPHCVGHHFWHEPEMIEKAYRAMDDELGQIAAQAGPDVRVMAFAGHGMGDLAHASWNLNEILDLLGFGKPGAKATERRHRRAAVNGWRLLKMKAPAALQYRIKEALPKGLQDWLLYLWYSGGRDCGGRRAFAVPSNEAVGAIRIAVKGRDRYGMIEPGDEYNTLCQEIAAALGELTDPVTGRSVVDRVTLTREAYSGEFLELLPDICVRWDQSFLWDSVTSPRFGTLELTNQDARTGTHTNRGFLVAAGPGIPAGVEAAGLSTYDIAPTVLEAAGVAVPAILDGKPIPALTPVAG
jgi:predicted AlkP superfamily phosphohydrolase/phosphomutase